MAATFNRDLDRAKSQIDVALSLNPNLAMAYNVLGGIRSYSGQPLEAIPTVERAMRLDPASNHQCLQFLGMAYLLASKYETAAALPKSCDGSRVIGIEFDCPQEAIDTGRPTVGKPRVHLGRAQSDFKVADNSARDVVLDREKVCQVAAVAVAP